MKFQFLFTLILFFPLYGLPLNISKLKLQSMNVKNTKQHKNKVIVTFDKCCPECSNHYREKKIFSLEPQEEKTISEKNGTIHNIISILPQQILNTVNNSPQPLTFPVHIKDFCNKEQIKYLYDEKKAKFLKQGLPKDISPLEFINKLNDIYKRNNLSQLFLSLPQNIQQEILHKKSRIPRIIHQVWFGKPMPNIYKKWQQILKKIHPGWHFICWTEKMLEKHFPDGLYNQITFDDQQKKNNYASMADIVRYEVVYRYGGIYCDTDILCFEPFDILNQLYDFYASIEGIDRFFGCANGFFAAKAQHPIMMSALEFIKKYENKNITIPYWSNNPGGDPTYPIGQIIVRTGPALLTKAIVASINNNNNNDIIFPHTYLLPFNNPERTVTVESFCYHDYKCPEAKVKHSWVKNLIKFQKKL